MARATRPCGTTSTATTASTTRCSAVFRARRRANPVTLAELRDIVENWSETALGVSELDIRKMLRPTAGPLAQAAGRAVPDPAGSLAARWAALFR
jgi:hypothetical protein